MENEKTKPEEEKHHKPWRIYKNVVMIGIAFMVHFTAYNGASDLQSSINAEAGLGTASLAAVYAGLILSSIFLPAALIKWIGAKWTMCLCFITYWPYIAAQLWPRFYSLIPTGILTGIGAAPLWCAMSIYMAVVSEVYSKMTSFSSEVLLMRFTGIFFAFDKSSSVIGNLISSLVLSSGDNKAALSSVNASLVPELCGANFLPSADAKKALVPQPPEKILMLVGIYLACMVGAVLVISTSVDSVKRYESSRSASSSLSGFALLSVTLKLLSEPNQLLLIIISMYIGMQSVFFSATITAAYISCSIGTGSVGLVMMTAGISGALASVFVAYAAKIFHRVILMLFAGIVYLALLQFLLFWKPQTESYYIFHIVAFLWGVCDTIYLVQLNAYHGILFPDQKEAAFTNFRLWKSIGYVIAYTTSHYLRTRTKIFMNLVVLVIGTACYCITEYREKLRKQNQEKAKMVYEGTYIKSEIN